MSELSDFLDQLDDEHETDLKYYAKRKLVVNWNEEDASALYTIKEVSEKAYLDIFAETLIMIEEIYESVKQDDGTDNWGLLTTKQIESYTLKLSQQKIQTALQVNTVRMEALFAKYSLDDDYHQAYLQGSGTNALREAKAHTDTIEKRYSYFFRYYIHTMCEGLARDIDSLIKNLNSVLYRRSNS